MAPSTGPAPAGGPKRKIPTIYLVGGVVGLVGLYYLWSKSKANAAAAAAPAAAPGGTAAGSYGNAGDLAALAPYLNAQSSASTPPTSGSGVGTLTGSGYGSTPGSTVSDSAGKQYVQVGPGQNLPAGVLTYYEPVPGVFTPLGANAPTLSPGTPRFVLNNSGSLQYGFVPPQGGTFSVPA